MPGLDASTRSLRLTSLSTTRRTNPSTTAAGTGTGSRYIGLEGQATIQLAWVTVDFSTKNEHHAICLPTPIELVPSPLLSVHDVAVVKNEQNDRNDAVERQVSEQHPEVAATCPTSPGPMKRDSPPRDITSVDIPNVPCDPISRSTSQSSALSHILRTPSTFPSEWTTMLLAEARYQSSLGKGYSHEISPKAAAESGKKLVRAVRFELAADSTAQDKALGDWIFAKKARAERVKIGSYFRGKGFKNTSLPGESSPIDRYEGLTTLSPAPFISKAETREITAPGTIQQLPRLSSIFLNRRHRHRHRHWYRSQYRFGHRSVFACVYGHIYDYAFKYSLERKRQLEHEVCDVGANDAFITVSARRLLKRCLVLHELYDSFHRVVPVPVRDANPVHTV
ncbi:hypothetical protein IAU59_003693 [Kwoniella sp. CBS 9459]